MISSGPNQEKAVAHHRIQGVSPWLRRAQGDVHRFLTVGAIAVPDIVIAGKTHTQHIGDLVLSQLLVDERLLRESKQ